MEYTNTISGLKSKRVEIAQEIERLQSEIGKLGNDRNALDRALRTFGCFEFDEAPRVYEMLFEKGQLRRFICDYIRENGPQTTRNMTLAVISMKGEDSRDTEYYAKIQRAVTRCLCHMAKGGQAVKEKIPGEQANTWALPG